MKPFVLRGQRSNFTQSNPARCPLSHHVYQGSKNEALKFKTYFVMCVCVICVMVLLGVFTKT